MCGIVGVINSELKVVKYMLKQLEIRGRDGFGYVNLTTNFGEKSLLTSSESVTKINYNDGDTLIGNSRAIPTTEFQQGAVKNLDNQQPMNDNELHIVFNGLIANDKQLINEFKLNVTQMVDTAMLCPLFNKIGVINGMKKLDGGFSIILYDKKKHNMWFGRNFLPLYYLYIKEKQQLIIASLKEMFPKKLQHNVVNVPPYTVFKFDVQKRQLSEYSLYRQQTNKRVLVICSSGIDSTTTAYLYKYFGYNVDLIHFNYGQAAMKVEDYAVRKITEQLGCKLYVYDAKSIFKNFKSVLLKEKKADGTKQIWDAESTFSYVPNRNAIFAMIAGAFAEQYKYDKVAFGGQQMDTAYPDNAPDFMYAVDNLYKFSLNWQSNIKFTAPLIHIIKHEIVAVGNKIGVPYEYVCACYYPKLKNGKIVHCLKCGCCQYRMYSFKMLGIKDKIIEHKNLKKEVDIDVNKVLSIIKSYL